MKRNVKLFLISALSLMSVTLMAFFAPTTVAAGPTLTDGINVCDFIPQLCIAITGNANATTIDRDAARSFLVNRVVPLIALLFVGIIVIAVVIIVRAGLKYMQSQGNEGQIEEATKAIKSVFMGIAVLFVGIVGLVLVLAFFNISGLFGQSVEIPGITDDQCPTGTQLQCTNPADPSDCTCV